MKHLGEQRLAATFPRVASGPDGRAPPWRRALSSPAGPIAGGLEGRVGGATLPTRSVWTAAIWAVAVSWAGACTGDIETASGGPGGPGPGVVGGRGAGGASGIGPPGGGGTGGTVVGGTGGGARLDCPAGTVPPSRFLRLTRDQLDHAVLDLLGDGTRPGLLNMPPDASLEHFDVAGPMDDATMERYWLVSEQVADRATADLAKLLPCGASVDEACMRQFIGTFGQRAFRRPLDAAEVNGYLTDVYTPVRSGSDAKTAVAATLRALLLSPHFIYRVELPRAGTGAKLDAYEQAARLSFFLWQSIPDDPLLLAAKDGRLGTPDGIRAEAMRMLGVTQKAGRAYESFGLQWLGVEDIDNVARSGTAWTKALKDSIRAEAARFVSTTFSAPAGTMAQIFSSNTSQVNPALAAIYGVTPPATQVFETRTLPDAQRAGALTRVGFLAARAHTDVPDPISPGHWVLQGMLCRTLPEVPNPVPIPDARRPEDTTRQQWERMPALCQGCHKQMLDLGASFLAYDSFGKHRTTETTSLGAVPIDTTGSVPGWDTGGQFRDAVELSRKLAGSQEVRSCFAKNMFVFAFSQSPSGAGGQCVAGRLADGFERSQGNLRELLLSVTSDEGFRTFGAAE